VDFKNIFCIVYNKCTQKVICLHDRANIEQTLSKRPANIEQKSSRPDGTAPLVQVYSPRLSSLLITCLPITTRPPS